MKSRLLRTLAALAVMLTGISSIAQNWYPNHSIGTSTGVYNYNYNQVPDPLVEIYPAAIPNTGLNYQGKEPDQRGYCVFGRVTKGMEIVDQIATAPLGPKEGFDNLPAEAIVIQSVEEVK